MIREMRVDYLMNRNSFSLVESYLHVFGCNLLGMLGDYRTSCQYMDCENKFHKKEGQELQHVDNGKRAWVCKNCYKKIGQEGGKWI